MEQLFVYGTLLFPEVVIKITGKSFNSTQAILQGYKRYRVKGCDYPAVIENKGDTVNGLLLENVDATSMRRITLFEGYEYEKRKVEVVINGEKIAVVAFTWKGNIKKLEGNDWDVNEFERNRLRYYS